MLQFILDKVYKDFTVVTHMPTKYFKAKHHFTLSNWFLT